MRLLVPASTLKMGFPRHKVPKLGCSWSRPLFFTRCAIAAGTMPATPIIAQRPPALGAFPLAGATGTERNLARAAAEAQAATAAQAQAGLARDPGSAVGPSLLRPPNTGDAGLAATYLAP
jgi:hypothetical protein